MDVTVIKNKNKEFHAKISGGQMALPIGNFLRQEIIKRGDKYNYCLTIKEKIENKSNTTTPEIERQLNNISVPSKAGFSDDVSIVLSVENKTDSMKVVGTKHLKFKKGKRDIASPFKENIFILILEPGEILYYILKPVESFINGNSVIVSHWDTDNESFSELKLESNFSKGSSVWNFHVRRTHQIIESFLQLLEKTSIIDSGDKNVKIWRLGPNKLEQYNIHGIGFFLSSLWQTFPSISYSAYKEIQEGYLELEIHYKEPPLSALTLVRDWMTKNWKLLLKKV